MPPRMGMSSPKFCIFGRKFSDYKKNIFRHDKIYEGRELPLCLPSCPPCYNATWFCPVAYVNQLAHVPSRAVSSWRWALNAEQRSDDWWRSFQRRMTQDSCVIDKRCPSPASGIPDPSLHTACIHGETKKLLSRRSNVCSALCVWVSCSVCQWTRNIEMSELASKSTLRRICWQ